MSKEITICLHFDQWEQLAAHLPDVWPEGTPADTLTLRCRDVDESEYKLILDTARKHCPSLVQEIEHQKRLP